MTQPAPASVTWSPSAIAAAGLASSRDAELWLTSMGVDPEDVADDELPLRIAECRDKQELFSRKYSFDCVLVLPLKSGNIAVMSLDRQHYEIVTPTDSDILQQTILECSSRFGARLKSEAIHVERLREVSAGEPGARQLAADLKRGARRDAERGSGSSAVVLEVSLDDL